MGDSPDNDSDQADAKSDAPPAPRPEQKSIPVPAPVRDAHSSRPPAGPGPTSLGSAPPQPRVGPGSSHPPPQRSAPPERGDSGRQQDAFQRIQKPGDLLPAVSFDGDSDSRSGSASQRSDDLDPGATASQIERSTQGVIVHQPGELIDHRYELVRPIDEGGMGVVWIAHSRPLEVDVAVKLTQAWRRGSVAAKRMEREARTAAKLNHPAVVRIYDFGRTDRGDPYIAMELLQGRSLGRQVEKKGPLTPIKAGQMLLPIVDALATAHEAGIVHRDLKPDNIFIARASGRTYPKLLDFSLVKLLSPDLSNASLTVDRRGVGTAPYLSPEQVKGLDDVDHRADIWAAAAVLYRVTTGRAPFDGVSRYDVINAVVEKEPTSTYDLAVGDEAFWRIIERGLRKNPDDRYQSMRDLGRDLALWLLSHGIKEDVGHVSLRRQWLGETEAPRPMFGAGGLGRRTKLGIVLAAGVVTGVILAPWLGCSKTDAPQPQPAPSVSASVPNATH